VARAHRAGRFWVPGGVNEQGRKKLMDDEAMLEQDDAPIHGWLQDQGQVGHVISSRIFFSPMEPLALRFDNSAFVSIICH
jgi:hypothetical protein